jgi:non-specific serine/threonine protein kinase/serine/threonine-protein kinase
MIQVCDGVHHAHQKGILHRDLKPTNILVEIQDGRPVPRIIDFGVAKAIDRPLTEEALFTEFGTVVGTPEYMSPEQAEMTGLDVDTRADVYALGVVLYQLLVGELPFDSRELRRSGLDAMRRKIREETPPKPSTRLLSLGASSGEIAKHRSVDPGTLIRQCRGDLDWITMKALEKDRTRRYASASALAEDLERHLRNEPVTAGPPSAGYRARKFVRRHRTGVAFVAVVLIAIVAGLAGTTYGMVRAKRAERKAELEAATLRETQDFMLEMFEINDPSESRGRAVTAKEILDRGAERIRSELGAEPEVQARLMESMGKVYRSLGLYRDSLPLLSGTVDVLSRAYGPESAEAARARTTLAGGLLKEGDPARAIPLLERSLAVQEAVLGPNDFELARTLNNLGLAYRLQGKFAEALPFLERALRIREAIFGPDHPEVAKQLGDIGPVRAQLQDVEGARRDLERAVAIREKALGADHPDVAASLDGLAFFFRGIGDLDRSFEVSTRALAIEETALGRDHPGLCNTLINLGIVERSRGRLAESEGYLRRSWEIARARLAPEQRDFKLSVRELAKTLEAAGRVEEAASLGGGP